MTSDAMKRTIRTLVAALISAAALALGPVLAACQGADVGGCVKAFGSYGGAFFLLAVQAVGTAVVTLVANYTEQATGKSLLGPKG
jgi:purine-cytosine permease-like protein